MDTASVVTAQPDNAAEMEAALTRVIGEIAEVREQMKADDAEIARLKGESAALKAESVALKAETQTLREETRTVIASLRSAA